MAPKKKHRLISKKVVGMQCDCSYSSKQAGYNRFDFCRCKLSGTKGVKSTVVSLPGEYNIGVMFVKGYK